jgi:microsomal dipeptidase-like Zn-dependent dipeptidase
LGEFDENGQRVPVTVRSPLVRAAQFGVVESPWGCGGEVLPGEEGCAAYCTSLGSAVGRHYETVVAAVFDRYIVTDMHRSEAPPTSETREQGVFSDLARYVSLMECGLRIVRTANEIRADNATTNVVLALEGMDFVHAEEQAGALLDAGIRVFALQYNRPNALAMGDCSEGAAEGAGLTPLGRDVVARLFATGAIIDLAHSAPETRREILDFAEMKGYGGRVAYTHGALFEDAEPERVTRLPGRFLYRTEAERILRLGGIVGLTPARPFYPSLGRFAESVHWLYSACEGGATGVALGTDFGGISERSLFPEVRGVQDIERIGDRLAERHGFTDTAIDAVLRTSVTDWLRRALQSSSS